MNQNDLSRKTFAAYKRLPPHLQLIFAHDLEYYRKDIRTGFLWWFVLGSHRGYLGLWWSQIAFWLTGGGLLAWWVIDAFRMEEMVLTHNRDVAERIMQGMEDAKGMGR